LFRLCSERNAIGTAFTANPSLARRDVLLVAVLALEKVTPSASSSSSSCSPAPPARPYDPKRFRTLFESHDTASAEVLNPLGPCGACTEWLRKIAEVNPDFKVMTFTDLECSKVYLREII
jgi:cytidine deaminase